MFGQWKGTVGVGEWTWVLLWWEVNPDSNFYALSESGFAGFLDFRDSILFFICPILLQSSAILKSCKS